MHAQAHIAALSRKHETLDNRISDEEHRPIPDNVVLGELKREKLRLKDEIQNFNSE